MVHSTSCSFKNCAVPLVASSFAFVHNGAKEEDHGFFRGFPSYWNVIAIYIWLLEVPPPIATSVIVLFTGLVFVPLKYIYPSKMRVLQRTTNGLAALWLLSSAGIAAPGTLYASMTAADYFQ